MVFLVLEIAVFVSNSVGKYLRWYVIIIIIKSGFLSRLYFLTFILHSRVNT